MSLAQYLAQFLVLGFTIYVWWAARRDLAQRAEQMSGPAIAEWERLQEAVQTLIADLERRATDVERRVAAAERRMTDAARRSSDSDTPVTGWGADAPAPEGVGPEVREATPQLAAHEQRYAPVYALADAGITDIAEIVRRTGLGHGEVAMILGLRGRQPAR